MLIADPSSKPYHGLILILSSIDSFFHSNKSTLKLLIYRHTKYLFLYLIYLVTLPIFQCKKVPELDMSMPYERCFGLPYERCFGNIMIISSHDQSSAHCRSKQVFVKSIEIPFPQNITAWANLRDRDLCRRGAGGAAHRRYHDNQLSRAMNIKPFQCSKSLILLVVKKQSFITIYRALKPFDSWPMSISWDW